MITTLLVLYFAQIVPLNIKHVWGLLQGSFGQQLEAIVEDNNGDMWHWQWTNEWKQVGPKLPGVKGG